MSSRSPEPVLPPSQVLDRVQQALGQTLEVAAERERALEATAPAALGDSDLEGAGDQALARLANRLSLFRSRVQEVEQRGAQVEATLQESGQVVHAWLKEVEAIGQRLAKEETPGV